MGIDDEMKADVSKTREGRQPNILMIFADEHNALMSGFMGHGIVRTPNLDRLASEGVAFTNAYCNSPLCSPSRQSFMAGLHCHRIGMWNNTSAMPEDTVTWAHMLSLAGYETSLFGRMHFNGYQKMYGFDRRPVLEANGKHRFHSWGIRSSHDWREPFGSSGDMTKGLVEAGPDDFGRTDICRHDYDILAGVTGLLREKAANRSGQPWAAVAGFNLPHPPWKARSDILDTYRGKGDLPRNREGAGRDACDRSLQRYKGDLFKLTDDQIRNAREVYFALITEMDEIVGSLLRALDETGLAEDTIVLYFSDHGEMAGEHGMWAKVSLSEGSVHVPLVIRWTGRYEAGRQVDTPVSLVDFYPTFLDWAGAELPEPLAVDGHSLAPLLEGRPEDFEGGVVFGELEGEGWNHPRAFVREGRFKYVYNHTADERLHDVIADPHEMADLSASPDHAETKARLRARIMAEWGDPNRIEREVILAQTRRKIARCRNVCMDMGW